MMTNTTKHNHPEADEQQKIFQWAYYARGRYPELELLYHIPNGGSRNKIEAANLKKQGVKAGVPDLCFPVARGGYHGLYIELKCGRNKPSDNQKKWIARLKEQGYAVLVCYGAEKAICAIENYLKLERRCNDESAYTTIQE